MDLPERAAHPPHGLTGLAGLVAGRRRDENTRAGLRDGDHGNGRHRLVHGRRAAAARDLRRRGRDAEKAEVIGDAIVVAVRTDSATIRVERATDAIVAGDWAAPQRKSFVTPAATSTGVLHP